MAATPNEIVDFWIKEVGPDGWYSVDPEIDKQIIERFGADREAAKEGRLDDWQQTALGSLALLILLDQFSRNMFRGDAEAFAEDEKAVAVARIAIVKDQDQEIPPPAQQFFYLPFMQAYAGEPTPEFFATNLHWWCFSFYYRSTTNLTFGKSEFCLPSPLKILSSLSIIRV